MIKNTCLFLGCLLLAFCLNSCRQIPYGSNKKAGKYYNIRGFKMYCETYGSGKPLLLIHGNAGSISTFKDVLPYFSDKYQVIVADGRGQGRSVDPKDSISFEMMADDYAALLDQMHIDSAYVFGWSDGGINALLMAMRHPGKVMKLAASGANLWPDSTAIDPKVWKEEQVKYNQLVSKPTRTEKEKTEWKFFKLDWEKPNIPVAALQKIKCPAFIIGGDHDLIRIEHLHLIYKNIPKATLWIVPNSGHGTLFEHRRKFEFNINEFFTGDYPKVID
jgi:pimeloyl-ACP methyl ester carboxylesterase